MEIDKRKCSRFILKGALTHRQWIVYQLHQIYTLFISFFNKGRVFYREKKKLVIISLFSILGIILAGTIFFFIVQTVVNTKLMNMLTRIETKTGIIVRYKHIRVNLYPVLTGGRGKVTIQGISASFNKEQPPFLSLSEVEIKGTPGSWFSCLRITDVFIRGITVKWSMDNLPVSTDSVKLLAAYIPGQRGVWDNGKVQKLNKNYIQPADKVSFTVEDGTFYFTRKNSDMGTSFPVLSRCWIHSQLNIKEKVISGQGAGSGYQKQDNVAYSFMLRPYYQTLSIHLSQYNLGPLTSFLPCSVKPDSFSFLDARVSFHKYYHDPSIHIDLKGYVNHITIENSLLAPEPVSFVSCGVRGRCSIDPYKKMLNTDELLVITRRAPLYIRNATIRLPFDKPLYCRMTIETDHLNLQDMLDSFPGELIPHIKNAQVNGFIDISVSLILDMEKIENTQISVQGEISSFKVIHPPSSCDVREIESMEYVYNVRTKDDEELSLVIGPLNEYFVPLENVGWYIIEAVLTCEDGNFFVHNGFALSHINGAIRQNLKKKRFIRGGSTVSMQLVKNLFLSGEKTISRKCEEVMLTWWMEQEINKNRLLEVYLNIVEWGPGIFGIGPASEHYFHCKPEELSCTQATWLANILVNPSLFYYMKAEEEIDENMRALIRFAMREMKKHGGISEEELNKAEKENFEVYFPHIPDDDEEEMDDETGKNVVQFP